MKGIFYSNTVFQSYKADGATDMTYRTQSDSSTCNTNLHGQIITKLNFV
jgi:hypothetical protein